MVLHHVSGSRGRSPGDLCLCMTLIPLPTLHLEVELLQQRGIVEKNSCNPNPGVVAGQPPLAEEKTGPERLWNPFKATQPQEEVKFDFRTLSTLGHPNSSHTHVLIHGHMTSD